MNHRQSRPRTQPGPPPLLIAGRGATGSSTSDFFGKVADPPLPPSLQPERVQRPAGIPRRWKSWLAGCCYSATKTERLDPGEGTSPAGKRRDSQQQAPYEGEGACWKQPFRLSLIECSADSGSPTSAASPAAELHCFLSPGCPRHASRKKRVISYKRVSKLPRVEYTTLGVFCQVVPGLIDVCPYINNRLATARPILLSYRDHCVPS